MFTRGSPGIRAPEMDMPLKASAPSPRDSSIGIYRVKIVRQSDNAPHKGKVAGEDEIARAIGRAQETFSSLKHAGTVRVNSDLIGN
jgi:hypothetical protein